MSNFFSFLLSSMSWPEIIGAVTGLISVYLTTRNNIWNWPWGVVSVLFYGWVFWHVQLYSSMALQLVYFLPMQFYGWWLWAKAGPGHHNDLPITRLKPLAWGICIAVGVLFTLGWGALMANRTDAALPYVDAFVTGFSIVAQYLDARKIYESWVLWIVVNVISIYLYQAQHLMPTAWLYVIFLLLAIKGARDWKRILGREETLA